VLMDGGESGKSFETFYVVTGEGWIRSSCKGILENSLEA
jgi:hypothetical protein